MKPGGCPEPTPHNERDHHSERPAPRSKEQPRLTAARESPCAAPRPATARKHTGKRKRAEEVVFFKKKETQDLDTFVCSIVGNTSVSSLHFCLLFFLAFSTILLDVLSHTLNSSIFILSCFPDGSAGNEPTCNAGDPCLIPGSGRSTGEEIGYPLQYSWASLVAQLVKNLPAMQETWVDPWVGKSSWRREKLPTPVFWPGEFHGLYSPWGRKESDPTE